MTTSIVKFKVHQLRSSYIMVVLGSLCTLFIVLGPTEELTSPRDLTDEPMVTSPSPVIVSIHIVYCTQWL